MKLDGLVGKATLEDPVFRFYRQQFYTSQRWKTMRDKIIIRDNGCDLAIAEREILGRIIIHHLNVVTLNDIVYDAPCLLDPENLICVSHVTHNAIHYGDERLLVPAFVERGKNDMCPWKRG